jgi:hypothetical protein
VKLVIDEMLSAAVAEQLRQRGRDVIAVDERPELRGLSDAELFERAQEAGRVVVTYNRDDFLALDRGYRHNGRDHHGLVSLHPRRFPQGKGTIGPLIASLERFLDGGSAYPSFVHWLQEPDA